MKKIIALALALVMVLSFAACGGVKLTDTADRAPITVFLDGKEIAKITKDDFAKKTTTTTLGDNTYYGKDLATLLKGKADLATVNAAFTKSADGYAAYFASVADLFVATFKANDAGEFEAVDGFTLASKDSKAKEVTDIYLLSAAQDWKTVFSIDGEDKEFTISDFMALKPQFVKLGHKYNGGSDYFEGEFLALDTKTLYESFGLELTEGTNDNGDKVYYADGYDIEFFGGVQGSDTDIEKKVNKDLKSDPLVEKSGWLCYYFVLVNGGDYHDIANADLDMSCILSGTGIRWMCTPIEKVTLQKAATE